MEKHLPQRAGQVASVTTLMHLGLPIPELEDNEYGNSGFPFVDTEILRDQLSICNSMGHDRLHPSVLQEPIDASAAPLSII